MFVAHIMFLLGPINPQAKSGPVPVYINKVLLKHNQDPSFT